MRRFLWILAAVWLTGVITGVAYPAQPAASAAEEQAGPNLRAALRPDCSVVRAGRPVWAVFTLTNLTAEPLTLTVPETEPAQSKAAGMGLPLAHVFSGKDFSAITIEDTHEMTFGQNVFVKPVEGVPPVSLAPNGSVGVRLELTRYYDALTRPGTYELVWRPYGGAIRSAPVSVTVLAEQQAVLVTDFGDITIRFYYDQAPNHVQNFLELLREGFYDGLTFHRVIPGGIIQGGDPRGDGRGTRPDGKRLKAEFSDVPFELGTVGMARSPRDADSASCQFFICLRRQPGFDGRQTAFGRVVGSKSFETLRQIAAIPTGPKDRPIQPVYIRAVSLENVPEREREASLSRGPDLRPGRVLHGRDGKVLLPPVQRLDDGRARGQGPATQPASRPADESRP